MKDLVAYEHSWTLDETRAALRDAADVSRLAHWTLRILEKYREEPAGVWQWTGRSLTVPVPLWLSRAEGSVVAGQQMIKPRRAILVWARPELLLSRSAITSTCGDTLCHRPSCQTETGQMKGSGSGRRQPAIAPLDDAATVVRASEATLDFQSVVASSGDADVAAIIRAAETLRSLRLDPIALLERMQQRATPQTRER